MMISEGFGPYKKVVGGGGICNETLLPICLLSLMMEKYQLTLEEEQF